MATRSGSQISPRRTKSNRKPAESLPQSKLQRLCSGSAQNWVRCLGGGLPAADSWLLQSCSLEMQCLSASLMSESDSYMLQVGQDASCSRRPGVDGSQLTEHFVQDQLGACRVCLSSWWTPSPSFPSSARKCCLGGLWCVEFPCGVSGHLEQPAFLMVAQHLQQGNRGMRGKELSVPVRVSGLLTCGTKRS